MCVIHNIEKEYIGEDRYLLNFQSEYGIFMFYLDLYTWLISGKQSNGSPLINIVIIDSIFFIQIRSKTLKRCIFIFFLSREFMYGKKKIEIFNLLEVHVRYLNTFKYNDSSKNKHADI